MHIGFELDMNWISFILWQRFPVELEGDPLFLCSIICEREWRIKNQTKGK